MFRLFISLKIEILSKNYPPIFSLIGYLNITSFVPDFSLAKDGERELFYRLRTRYRKAVEERKDIENIFYSNDSLNDDLESRFRKAIGDALRACTIRLYSCL
jgi:hypothetical protein